MAANAQFYFAFVEASETTFSSPLHARNDATILAFSYDQKEGEFATLRVVTRNPLNVFGNAVGLLNAGRKIWAWFSWDIGSGPQPIFFGRLIGVPGDFINAAVTLDFQGRPANYNTQWDALAESLRVLPYWDQAFIDEQRRDDNSLVLDARPVAVHIDPVTHAVTVSNFLLGEDGTVVFTAGQHVASQLKPTIGEPPLTGVSVDALAKWTQRAAGNLDLTDYITGNWPNDPTAATGEITSFSLGAESWPKAGVSLGDGWIVSNAACTEVYPLEVRNRSQSLSVTVNWWDGASTSLQTQRADDYLDKDPPGSITLADIVTASSSKSSYQDGKLGSWSVSMTWSDGLVPLHHLKPTLVAQYDAARQMRERVRFTLTADVQAVSTNPGDDEPLRLDNLASVDLSETVGEGSALEMPIGDPRRRSYFTQARGEQSLQYLISLARARLLKRARAVEITLAPVSIARFMDVSLRKSGQVFDPRLPGGVATGKIVAVHLALQPPSDSSLETSVDFTVTIGCAVGNGGSLSDVAGNPLYVDDDYIGQDQDYQEYEGHIITFNSDVGFEQVLFAPNDDGIDFISGVSVASAIQTGLTVTNPPATQRVLLGGVVGNWSGGLSTGVRLFPPPDNPTASQEEIRQALVDDRTEAFNNVLTANPTTAKFKLKPMSAEFETPIDLVVTSLKVPTGIDLMAS